jgi:hypothetical protein
MPYKCSFAWRLCLLNSSCTSCLSFYNILEYEMCIGTIMDDDMYLWCYVV